MKKILCIALAFVLAFGVLAGCGAKETTYASPEGSSGEPTVIRLALMNAETEIAG